MVDRPQVFYCYAEKDQEVIDFLRTEPIDLTLVNTGTDDNAYYRFLKERWEIGSTFFVVEHDVLPYPGAIQELADCPLPFCGKPYHIHGGYIACFGCTKFGADLIAAYPDAIVAGGEKAEPKGQGRGYTHWETLDSRIVLALVEDGWKISPNPPGAGWPHQHKRVYPGKVPPVPKLKTNMDVTWWL